MIDDNIFIDSNLPKPLNKEELFQCIKQARDGDLKAREKAITHNIRLVLDQIRKRFANLPYEKKELVAIGNIGLVQAVDNFDITKGFNFSTYAIRCIDNEILMFMRKEKRYSKEISLEQRINSIENDEKLTLGDTIIGEDDNFTEEIAKQELLLEIKKQVEMLDGRDKEIIKLYFGFYDDKQYFQKEIANIFGLSQRGVSKIISRVVDTIKKRIENQNKERLLTTLRCTEDLVNPKTQKDWNQMYKLAEIYFHKYGHLKIPTCFETTNEKTSNGAGYRLGTWVRNQRIAYKNRVIPKEDRTNTLIPLTDAQVELLESIGMIWDVKKNAELIQEFCSMHSQHGLDYKKHKKDLENKPYQEVFVKSCFLSDKNIPLVGEDGRLHEIFFMSDINMQANPSYGVSMLELIKKYMPKNKSLIKQP